MDTAMPGGAASVELARSARVEAWLASGGVVLAASERAARAVAAGFHAARQREGLRAWATPAIHVWDNWVEEQWRRNRDGRMLLRPLQERALWMRAIGRSRRGEAVPHKRRLASAAQQAHRLLCAYAPESLAIAARRGWSSDAAVFSEWLDEFEKLCREEDAISATRLPLELAARLRRELRNEVATPLLLVGFDRVTQSQKLVLEAWGEWQADAVGSGSAAQYLAARDADEEVEACVLWLRQQLNELPDARWMVITPNLTERRGELERALRRDVPGQPAIHFEFSLGVPLLRMSLARSAGVLLRWLSESISEAELDWLLGSGHLAASAEEDAGLQSVVLAIQRQDWGRPEWRLEEFLSAAERWMGRADSPSAVSAVRELRGRVNAARANLAALPPKLSPQQWAAEAQTLLAKLGWPGFKPLSSMDYQARERWEQVVDDCGSLGFDGSRMAWGEFAATVEDACSEAVFAAESEGPRVLVTEPLESAGQLADGIWFLGADEASWPAPGQPHPLLPVALQRSAGMPHASLRDDWELAERVSARLLSSAKVVVFSYAQQHGEVEARPSRIATAMAGECAAIEREAAALPVSADRTEAFEDAALIPFPATNLSGGAGTLTRQSLCPFQAFGVARLHAEENRTAGPGLSPSQRGLLLHSVMRKVWSGTNAGGLASLNDLLALHDLAGFVSARVAAAMREAFDAAHRGSFPDRYPRRYLELESERLTRLICEWLEYERTRQPFTVEGTEKQAEVALAGLTMHVRLDRIDALPDGSRLIVDYKTGHVHPKAWDGERPEDVQLPLYACFAVPDKLEGLVFAQLTPGEMKFKGRLRDAAAKLISVLPRTTRLIQDPLTKNQLEDWRRLIEQLAQDFLEGRVEVDPKDANKTCERCHLHAVCRVYENLPEAAWQSDYEEDSAEDGGENE